MIQLRVAGNDHLLLVAEGVDQFVIESLYLRQQAQPVCAGVWPGQLDCRLRMPFGQEAFAHGALFSVIGGRSIQYKPCRGSAAGGAPRLAG